MGDAWMIGPFIIQDKWLVYLITLIVAYLVLRVAVKTKSVTLSILDSLWTAFLLFLIVFKLSYTLFHPLAVLKNPPLQLYFTGGEKGIGLGLLSVLLYFYYKSKRSEFSFKFYMEMSLLAMLTAIFVNQTIVGFLSWPNSFSLFSQAIIALILLMLLVLKGKFITILKKSWPILLLAGMAGWGVFDYARDYTGTMRNDIQADFGINKGDIAPDVTLQTLQGEYVTLSDFRGKNVLLNFWATWCPPCRAEMPDMQRYYDKHKENDFIILAVNVTESERNRQNVHQFIDEYDVTFPVALDIGNDATSTYEVIAYPTSYFIDRNGKIQTKKIGPMNEDFIKRQIERMEK